VVFLIHSLTHSPTTRNISSVLKFLALTSNVASWLELLEDEEIEVPVPEYDKIKEIMNKLTLNKAPQSDITPELIQVGGEELWNRMHKLTFKR
jgi:hypothetical protein